MPRAAIEADVRIAAAVDHLEHALAGDVDRPFAIAAARQLLDAAEEWVR